MEDEARGFTIQGHVKFVLSLFVVETFMILFALWYGRMIGDANEEKMYDRRMDILSNEIIMDLIKDVSTEYQRIKIQRSLVDGQFELTIYTDDYLSYDLELYDSYGKVEGTSIASIYFYWSIVTDEYVLLRYDWWRPAEDIEYNDTPTKVEVTYNVI